MLAGYRIVTLRQTIVTISLVCLIITVLMNNAFYVQKHIVSRVHSDFMTFIVLSRRLSCFDNILRMFSA
jgi:hypothetical protein